MTSARLVIAILLGVVLVLAGSGLADSGLAVASEGAHGNGHGEPPNIDWAHDYTTAGAFQKMRVTNWDECPNYEVVRRPG